MIERLLRRLFWSKCSWCEDEYAVGSYSEHMKEPRHRAAVLLWIEGFR